MDDDLTDATGRPRRHDGRDPWSLVPRELLEVDASLRALVPGAIAAPDSLAPGDVVLLLFTRERLDPQGRHEALWVEVEAVEGDEVQGVMDNQPTWIRGLAAGDPIRFAHGHILRRAR
jgi:hypothetical protein